LYAEWPGRAANTEDERVALVLVAQIHRHGGDNAYKASPSDEEADNGNFQELSVNFISKRI
jgi:hypothetical protein